MSTSIPTKEQMGKRYGVRFERPLPGNEGEPPLMDTDEISGPLTYHEAAGIAGAFASFGPVVFDWTETTA